MDSRDRFQHPARRTGAPARRFVDLTVPEHACLFGLIQTDGHHRSGTRTPEEDEVVLGDQPLAEIATALGRTYQSVNLRRSRLRASGGSDQPAQK